MFPAKKKDAIIDDLLKKRPSGPVGAHVTYTEQEEYCYDRRRYYTKLIPSEEYFGYDPKTLFGLGIKQKSDAVSYVRNRWFEGKSSWDIGRKKSTITRRANRIWSRIEQGVRSVKNTGGLGVYRVDERYGYSFPMGHVYGNSMEEALETAKMSYGYLADGGDTSRLSVDFVTLGSIDELSVLNAVTIDKVNDRIKRCRMDIEKANSDIEKLKARLTTISLVEAQMISLETPRALK